MTTTEMSVYDLAQLPEDEQRQVIERVRREAIAQHPRLYVPDERVYHGTPEQRAAALVPHLDAAVEHCHPGSRTRLGVLWSEFVVSPGLRLWWATWGRAGHERLQRQHRVDRAARQIVADLAARADSGLS